MCMPPDLATAATLWEATSGQTELTRCNILQRLKYAIAAHMTIILVHLPAPATAGPTGSDGLENHATAYACGPDVPLQLQTSLQLRLPANLANSASAGLPFRPGGKNNILPVLRRADGHGEYLSACEAALQLFAQCH